jgi:hypothetical protein
MQATVTLNVHVKVDDPACLKIAEDLNAQATEGMKSYNSTNLVNFAGVNDVCTYCKLNASAMRFVSLSSQRDCVLLEYYSAISDGDCFGIRRT